MKILWLSFLALFFSSLAFILSDQVLYRLWLVPQLQSFYHVPSYYYILVLFPIILVVIVFGLMLSAWRQIFLVAFIFTICHQVYISVSAALELHGYLFGYSLDNPFNFWILLSVLVSCIYAAALSIVWYTKVLIYKISVRIASRSRTSKEDEAANFEKDNDKGRAPKRTTYHVVPDPDGWRVKKMKAKKASSTHLTKDEALRAASDAAKSHPLSQVIVHNSSGLIKSDRTYEYRHYRKKKRKKEISKKIKKGLDRKKKEKSKERLKRRKAAKLGIARMKRKQYLKRKSGKKLIRKKKK